MNRDVIAGLGLLAFAGLYFAATLRIQESSLSDEVGANGVPLLLAGLLAVLAALLAVRGWFAGRATRARKPDTSEGGAPVGRVLGFLGVAVLYGPVAYLLGYAAGLAVLIMVVAIYEGARLGWSLAAVAVGGAAFFYVVFVKLLGVAQPPGLF